MTGNLFQSCYQNFPCLKKKVNDCCEEDETKKL